MSRIGMNKVFLIGQVASEPRFKVVPQKDLPRLWFRLCTVETSADDNGFQRERSAYHSIVVWGGLARVLKELVREKQTVAIEGRIASRSFDQAGKPRYETEIVVSKLVVLEARGDAAAA